ncbi:MAG: DNA/RNA nuclease SfsA [Ruminococcaceae bacterium]|nr:DNA/RNA nuclease SfsA [Oscillospiraceae bacterium]
MKYTNTVKGIFISRPNRFIAEVEIDGEIKICHVKNTGRCKELLINGVTVILEKNESGTRKTEYDLVAVYKGDELINIDSQAPNKVVFEWLSEGKAFDGITLIKPESRYKNSRFDFYIETENRKIFAEVKGVTLERDGVVLFPDAPTERGVKHINELTDAKENGYEAYIFFVVQMKKCKYFTPNEKTDPEFAKALRNALSRGVKVMALNCNVNERGFDICGEIEKRI